MKIAFDSITTHLVNQRKQVHEVCRQFSKSPSKGNLKRLKQLFNDCGEEVFIEYGFHMDYGDTIRIGHRTFINANCTIIDAPKSTKTVIEIGNDCLFGPNIQLLAVSHDMDPEKRLHKENFGENIIIGNNVWLGAGVTLLGGVTIGDNCVIGAGSVVTHSTESGYFYAGNPAVKIRQLSAKE